ncbi:MAG: discoidin domain-containing protein [Phycisphaerales bacterium]|nr:MAG: discoidin domain-containing protein [Phycisphaerales bacterium]
MSRRLFYLVFCVLALMASGTTQGGTQKWENVVRGANPIHWYRFDETPGTTVADDEGSADLDGEYRSLVELGQEGLLGAGQAVRFERGGQNDVMATLGGDVTTDEWTAEFIVMKMSNTVAQALSDSGSFSLRVVGWGVNEELSFTEYGVIDAQFTAVGGADLVAPVEQWMHVVYRKSGGETHVFLDGVLIGTTSTLIDCPIDSFGGRAASASDGMDGFMDEAVIYDYALTDDEIRAHAAAPFLPDVGAIILQPDDGATDVPRDAVLGWMAGTYAETHDVYLGTILEDVNTASRDNPLDVLVNQGQTETTYDPAGSLQLGQTYYWRIDEVNGAPDNTIFKGDVWSFTVEPVGYPIEDVTATSNGVSEEDAGPENTINGSGLNADDQHSTDSDDMWLARPVDADPIWIQYEFDRVYKLHELIVWNYNVQFELLLGFGIQSVAVDYSEDGMAWMSLGDVDLAQATARDDYTSNTTIDMAGVPAKYVKLTVNSGFGMMGQYGLSEVRVTYLPVQAREPQPADGAVDVNVETMFTWRAGREAASHEVYYSTDPNAPVLAATVAETEYDPGALALGTAYYWQITEVNEAEAVSTWEGSVWSFVTQEYLVVDDFESYDDEENRIYDTWLDGWINETGSTVGYLEEPFAETLIVHSGVQAMPLFYDNAGVATSEAEIALTQDWTASGIKSLALYFYGALENTGQLYVEINGNRVDYDGAASDLATPQWQPWNIDLLTVGGDLSNVTELTIGIKGAGAAGVVYVDDIRLYPETPQYIVPVQPDEANLVAHYAFEGDLTDSVGSHNGTAIGDAQVVSDPARGQVLSVDGGGDAVDVAYSPELNPEAFTVSLWANPDPAGLNYRSPLTSRDDGPQRGYILYLEPGNTWQFWTGTGTGWDNAAGPPAVLGEWTHLAATFENEQKQLFVNGRVAAESTAPLSLNEQRPLRIGAGATEGDGNYFFYGLIDEVLLYNRALSAGEVAGLAGRTEPLHQAF